MIINDIQSVKRLIIERFRNPPKNMLRYLFAQQDRKVCKHFRELSLPHSVSNLQRQPTTVALQLEHG